MTHNPLFLLSLFFALNRCKKADKQSEVGVEKLVMQRELPTKIKIFDTTYKIQYTDKPSDVDIFKRDSLWGQIDYWTRTIRIYNNNLDAADIWQTIWHEVLHGICDKLKLEGLRKDETTIDLLATGINSVILDNKL